MEMLWLSYTYSLLFHNLLKLFLQRLVPLFILSFSFFPSANFSAPIAYRSTLNFQNQPQTVVLTAKGNQIEANDVYQVYLQFYMHVDM